MNITNISDENLCNCSDNDNNILLEISPLVKIIITVLPCVFSLLCLISFILKTLFKK